MALLNRFIQRFPTSLSLRKYIGYAIGEVLLIFTGITLSLWFSNWNETRKERDLELKLLKELRTGLVQDSLDTQGNIELRNQAKAASERILAFIEQKTPYHDSLNVYFPRSLQFASTMATTSAYETLKSHGLQVITNAELRARIIQLYDIGYETIHISEERQADLYHNHFVPFNSKYFHSTHPYQPMKILDYNGLMTDPQYKYNLNINIAYNDFVLAQSEALMTKIKELVAAIDTEIEKMQ